MNSMESMDRAQTTCKAYSHRCAGEDCSMDAGCYNPSPMGIALDQLERNEIDVDVVAAMRLLDAAPDLLAALEDLRKELRPAVKLDVKKYYSLMVAEVAADKAIRKARGC